MYIIRVSYIQFLYIQYSRFFVVGRHCAKYFIWWGKEQLNLWNCESWILFFSSFACVQATLLITLLNVWRCLLLSIIATYLHPSIFHEDLPHFGEFPLLKKLHHNTPQENLSTPNHRTQSQKTLIILQFLKLFLLFFLLYYSNN